MSQFDWVLLANCDLIEGRPTGETTPGLSGAFNLVSVVWRTDDATFTGKLSDLAYPVLFPWGSRRSTSVTPAISDEFLLLRLPPPKNSLQDIYGGNGKALDTEWPILKPRSRVSINDDLARQVESAFEALVKEKAPPDEQGNRDLSRIVARAEEREFVDSTWSALLGGASQQGFPVAHSLGLSFWIYPEKPSVWSDVANQLVTIIPKTLYNLPIELVSLAPGDASAGVVEVVIKYKTSPADAPGIRLRTNAFKCDGGSGVALRNSFIGRKQRIHSATFTNWMGTLPQKLGEFLDLIWVLKSCPWPDTIAGVKVEEIYRTAARLRAEELAAKVLGSVNAELATAALGPANEELATTIVGSFNALTQSAKSALAEMPIRKHVIEPMLLLFHDHADLGLRTPFYSPKTFSYERRTQLSGSLAFELLSQIARGRPGASGEADEKLSEALYIVAANLTPVIYPLVDPWTLESPVMIKWTTKILLPVLRQIDGSEDRDSHSGQYGDLRKVLEFEACLRPLMGTEVDVNLSTDAAVGDAVKRSHEVFSSAWEQLSRLQEDENALLLLFCLQWDWLLDNLKKKGNVAYRQLIGVLGFYDNKPDGPVGNQEPASEPLVILNGRSRELIREYLQANHISLRQRYADCLTTAILPTLEELSNQQNGESSRFFELSIALMDPVYKSNKGAAELKKDTKNFADFMERTAWLVTEVSKGDALKDYLPHNTSPDEEAAVRSQLFQGAIYLGKALIEYSEWRARAVERQTIDRPSLPSSSGIGVGLDFQERLAKTICQGCFPVNGTSATSEKQISSKTASWKYRPWNLALISLDRVKSFLTMPPPLLVPLLSGSSEYDETRYSGVLILARRIESKEESWWLVNVGEPIIEKERTGWTHQETLAGTVVDSRQAGELTDALTDEVSMSWFGRDPKRFIRFSPESRVVPAPWQLAKSFGILQSVVEFRGKPLSVRLWEDEQDDRSSNTEIPVEENVVSARALDLARYQIISVEPEYKGWGPVPGLRYDKKWKYEFLFVPVHNTGALPVAFQTGDGNAGSLWQHSGSKLGLPVGVSQEADPHKVTVTSYVRRIPIAAVRLARPVGSDLERFYHDYQAPVVPEGVRPLYADLQDQSTFHYLDELRPVPDGIQQHLETDPGRAPTPLPAQSILLRSVGRNDALESMASFVIRPPATSIENWVIWQSSQIDDETDAVKKSNVLDCISDVKRLARELSRSAAPTLDKARGLELTQLLDDPAVKAVTIRVKLVLDLRRAVGSGDTSKAEYPGDPIVLLFPTQKLTEYKAEVDPPLVGGDTLGEEVRQRCRAIVQSEARQDPATACEVRLDWAESSLDISKHGRLVEDGAVTIHVPAGCIAEIELTPCIDIEEHSSRFGIYDGDGGDLSVVIAKNLPRRAGSKTKFFEVPRSIYRIWVEAVPSPRGEQEQPKIANLDANPHFPPRPYYMPNSKQVWDSLRLAEIGTYGRENRRIQRLEIAVLPKAKFPAAQTEKPINDVDLLQKWCFVSEVRAEIQPWVWRGLPEGGFRELAQLIAPSNVGGSEGHVSDEDASILQKLVIGEAPAFGEREDAAARVQTGLVNYAAPFKLWWDHIETSVPPFVIYQDQGEQEEVPRYYRVKLVVRSRYAGLGSSPETSGAAYSHATPVSSEFQWPWSVDLNQVPDAKRKTPVQQDGLLRKSSYRRILFRGRLRRPLDLPRVKMVIPLLEAFSDKNASSPSVGNDSRPCRPGIIVLTREPLRSPWHRLIAEVDWARVRLGRPGEQEVIKERTVIGFDPITKEVAFSQSFISKSDLISQTRLDGRAFGLTYEREADAALFPNAGFYFDPPFQRKGAGLPYDPTLGDFDNDWFAELRFRWEIQPAHVMDNLADTLIGESTQPWQVRFLAPFQWVRFKEGTVDLAQVVVRYQGGAPVFFKAKEAGMPLGIPLGPEYGLNVTDPAASPNGLLLLVAWSLVPDFLNAERSKTAHSIFAFRNGKALPVYWNKALQGVPQPDGANFMLLFGRKEDLDDFVSQLPSTGEEGLDILVSDFLFPAPSGEENIDQDARAMITRCSPPIFSV